MLYYAQLNKDDICIGISQLSGIINDDSLVQIESFNQDFIWRKYDKATQVWSEEKYEPQAAVPLTRLEEAEQQIEELTLALLTQGGQ